MLKPYRVADISQVCQCANPNCAQRRYGGRYFMTVFDAGTYTVTWWLSRN